MQKLTYSNSAQDFLEKLNKNESTMVDLYCELQEKLDKIYNRIDLMYKFIITASLCLLLFLLVGAIYG